MKYRDVEFIFKNYNKLEISLFADNRRGYQTSRSSVDWTVILGGRFIMVTFIVITVPSLKSVRSALRSDGAITWNATQWSSCYYGLHVEFFQSRQFWFGTLRLDMLNKSDNRIWWAAPSEIKTIVTGFHHKRPTATMLPKKDIFLRSMLVCCINILDQFGKFILVRVLEIGWVRLPVVMLVVSVRSGTRRHRTSCVLCTRLAAVSKEYLDYIWREFRSNGNNANSEHIPSTFGICEILRVTAAWSGGNYSALCFAKTVKILSDFWIQPCVNLVLRSSIEVLASCSWHRFSGRREGGILCTEGIEEMW